MQTMTLEATLPALPPSSRLREDELIERLQQGQLAAIGEAYDQHHEVVRGFARRLLGDASSAEDLVQEVFVALPRAARRFRGDSSLRSFLVAIAVNQCKHHIRASSRRRAALARAQTEPPPPPPLAGENPERDLQRRQLADVLTRALDQLSVPHRVTFVLCEVERQTSREAAVILGVPEGTVRTRLLHAKKKLRTLLEKEGVR